MSETKIEVTANVNENTTTHRIILYRQHDRQSNIVEDIREYMQGLETGCRDAYRPTDAKRSRFERDQCNITVTLKASAMKLQQAGQPTD